MKKLKAKLKASLRSFSVWFNCALLGFLPIFEVFRTEFMVLEQYLPANVYKCVGVGVVILNVLVKVWTAKSPEPK